MEENFNSSQDNFTTEKVNVISNCLFGNYVNNEYIITDDIKDELVNVRKVKKSVFKNSVFCGAYIVGYGDIIFEVTFQKNTVKSIAKAELFVLENEDKINGYIQNTIRTKVGEYIDELDNFIEKTYDYFHIELTDNKVSIDKNKNPIINEYINAKKNFSINMAKLTKKDYNKLYRNYVTARLELLKKSNNDYSNTVLDKFNGEFSKIENYFLKENNYKALSELLDKCIEDVSGVNPKFAQDEKQTMDNLVPIIDNFSKEADTIYEKAQPKAMNSLDKQDRTRMEDIEREMYEYQQVKKTEKVKPQQTSSSNDYSSSSSSDVESKPQKEQVKTPQKVEQPVQQKSEPRQEERSEERTYSNNENTSGTVLNQRPTTPIFPVNPTLPRRNQEETQSPQNTGQQTNNPTLGQQINNTTQAQYPFAPTQVVREQVIVVPSTSPNDRVVLQAQPDDGVVPQAQANNGAVYNENKSQQAQITEKGDLNNKKDIVKETSIKDGVPLMNDKGKNVYNDESNLGMDINKLSYEGLAGKGVENFRGM